MVTKIRAPADFLSGVIFFSVGFGFAYVSSGYELGSATEMGPGYFPFGLGILLCILGVIIAVSALSPAADQQSLPKISFKVAFFVVAPVILFALLLDWLGFVLAVLLVVIGSSFACMELRWHTTLASAAVLTVISIVVFAVLLNVQIHLWPAFVN